jgi:tripartite-type tricarboxylate transporter receptor subunit TctC
MRTRRAMIALACTACITPLASAQAPAFPAKPITIVIGSTPGSATDGLTRAMGAEITRLTGQPVIVESRAGAFGSIAAQYVAKAPQDGYTLFMTTNTTQSANPHLLKKIAYDPIKDFAPVSLLARGYLALVVNPQIKANNVAELVALAKAAPGKYTYASAGNGTLNHLIGEMLQKAAGIQLQHVPYKGSAQAAADVAGGQVPLSVQSLPSVIGLVKSGKLKVLGVVNEKRVAALPDVPTIGETLKGFGQAPWYAMFAPAGTPAPIVARLQTAVANALEQKETAEKLAVVGCEPFKGTAAQLAALVQSDLPKWARVVKETGAQVD